jgi:organic radical activating enzyme
MNFIDTVSATGDPVVVFGASVMGKILLDSLDLLHLRPVCFCDNDAEKQCERFHGYEVISFESLRREYPHAVMVIAAGRYFSEIKQQLIEAGFKDIFSDADVIGCIDLKATPPDKLQKIVWHAAKLGKLSQIMDIPEGTLHVPRLNVVITSRCTLNCRHCSSLMPYYETPSDFDLSAIVASLDALFACADLVYHVELLGGEPFLNKDLPIIADHLLDSERVLHMDVITNGTVLPPDRMLSALNRDAVSVVIDDYGQLSRKKRSLSDALQRHGIDFRVNKHWAWADLGGFEARHLSEKALTERFRKCNFNTCTELLDGKLYRCPRSSHGTKTGMIPEYAEDYLDISHASTNDPLIKESVKGFLCEKRFIRACDHCNGNTPASLTLMPAEQKPRGENHA